MSAVMLKIFVVLLTFGAGCGACEEPPEAVEEVERHALPVDEAVSIEEACEAAVPAPLIGPVTIGLDQGTAPFPGSCAPGRAATIFRLDVDAPSRLRVETHRSGAAFLWVAKGCGSEAEELICDSFLFDEKLTLDQQVEPGPYYVAVAADDAPDPIEATLEVLVESTAELSSRCADAPALTVDEPRTGSTVAGPDRYPTSCYEFGSGPETMHKLTLERSSIVELTVTSAADIAVWTVDECPLGPIPSSIPCTAYVAADDAEDDEDLARRLSEPRRVTLQTTLDAGEHYVFVDTFEDEGAEFVLQARIVR